MRLVKRNRTTIDMKCGSQCLPGVYIFLAFCFLFASSCTKNNVNSSLNATNPTFQISPKGGHTFNINNAKTYFDSVVFTSNAGPTSKLLWFFPDGTISTETNPVRYFNTPYNIVSLVVDNDTANIVSGVIRLSPPGSAQMDGVWRFYNGFEYCNCCNPPQQNTNDDTCTIHVINNDTITVNGTKLIQFADGSYDLPDRNLHNGYDIGIYKGHLTFSTTGGGMGCQYGVAYSQSYKIK